MYTFYAVTCLLKGCFARHLAAGNWNSEKEISPKNAYCPGISGPHWNSDAPYCEYFGLAFSASKVTAVGHAAMLAAIQRYVPALIPSTYGSERLELLRQLEKMKRTDTNEAKVEDNAEWPALKTKIFPPTHFSEYQWSRSILTAPLTWPGESGGAWLTRTRKGAR
ncbi:hypothetical protein Cgig2_011305 [Carnegiea gigantea]|uniref:Uncharacterized protein n=1 Tax=Carnegiea gigantea TaxID=171969 RepID=A0A9Q1JRP9_9CARY|nr:hypothetical protein Cgig2_011305 [Carnegiea gigantea]